MSKRFLSHNSTIVLSALIAIFGIAFLVWVFSSNTLINAGDNTGAASVIISGSLQAKTGRAATLVVAASNGAQSSKDQADFIADGRDDQVEIQAAIDALSSSGGTVQLSEGTFNLSSGIVISSDGLTLKGQAGQGGSKAPGTYFETAIDQPNSVITVNDIGRVVQAGISLEDFWIRNWGNGDGIVFGPDSGIFDSRIEGVNFLGNAYHLQSAFLLYSFHSSVATDISITNTGIGFSLGGSKRSVFSNIMANDLFDGIFDTQGTLEELVITGVVADLNHHGQGIRIRGITRNVLVKDNAIYRPNSGIIAGQVRNEGGVDNLTIANNLIAFPKDAGIRLEAMPEDKNKYIQIIGNKIISGSKEGIIVDNSDNLQIIDNQIINPGQDSGTGNTRRSGISIDNTNGRNITIANNQIIDDQNSATMQYGIYYSNTSGGYISENYIKGSVLSGISLADGFAGVIKNNYGFATENLGTAVVNSGSTYADVVHGLAMTPSLKSIQVTPSNNLGNASKFWISNAGASTFRINVDVAPGSPGANFSWLAKIY